jgi:hypothetical protein
MSISEYLRPVESENHIYNGIAAQVDYLKGDIINLPNRVIAHINDAGLLMNRFEWILHIQKREPLFGKMFADEYQTQSDKYNNCVIIGNFLIALRDIQKGEELFICRGWETISWKVLKTYRLSQTMRAPINERYSPIMHSLLEMPWREPDEDILAF